MWSQFRRSPVYLQGQVLVVPSRYVLITLTENCVAGILMVIKRTFCVWGVKEGFNDNVPYMRTHMNYAIYFILIFEFEK
jgi:hypothetical protein